MVAFTMWKAMSDVILSSNGRVCSHAMFITIIYMFTLSHCKRLQVMKEIKTRISIPSTRSEVCETCWRNFPWYPIIKRANDHMVFWFVYVSHLLNNKSLKYFRRLGTSLHVPHLEENRYQNDSRNQEIL